jgi:putative Mg2+ transporter-C (MgtC) family protein
MEWDYVDTIAIQAVSIAAGLGAVVGLERELARKPAGLRTLTFVCAGAALMMVLGQAIIDEFQESESNSALTSDPIRVLQAIVVGISFLGAGTIVHDRKDGVEGLTTAATIYLTAGIGVAVAVERVFLAIVITFCSVCILFIIGYLERFIERRFGTVGKSTEHDSAAD